MTKEQGEALLLYIDAAVADGMATLATQAAPSDSALLDAEHVTARAAERTATKLAFLALLP